MSAAGRWDRSFIPTGFFSFFPQHPSRLHWETWSAPPGLMLISQVRFRFKATRLSWVFFFLKAKTVGGDISVRISMLSLGFVWGNYWWRALFDLLSALLLKGQATSCKHCSFLFPQEPDETLCVCNLVWWSSNPTTPQYYSSIPDASFFINTAFKTLFLSCGFNFQVSIPIFCIIPFTSNQSLYPASEKKSRTCALKHTGWRV